MVAARINRTGQAPVIRKGENTADAARFAAAAAASAAAAAASAPGANTAALRAAIRTLGNFPRPASALASNLVPTVTVNGFTSFELAGSWPGSPNVPATSSKLQWRSGPMAASGRGYAGYFPYPKTNHGLQYTSVLETNIAATGCEIPIANNGPASSNSLRIYVNNCEVYSGTPAGTAGEINRIKLIWPDATLKTVRIETERYVLGINVANTATVTNPAISRPLMSLIGDSFFDFYSAGTVMAQCLGFAFNNAGIGGTGVINPNTGGGYPNYQASTRVQDWTMSGVTDDMTGGVLAPSLGIICGSGNDDRDSSYWGGAATLEAALYNGTSYLLDQWDSANAGVPVLVYGPWANSGTLNTAALEIRDGMRNACWRAGKQFRFIDLYDAIPKLRAGSPSTAGTQADRYVGSDNVHPAQPIGSVHDGMWMASEARRVILTELI